MGENRTKPTIATLLYRHSPRLLVLAIIMGAFAGALYSLIIPFVMQELTGRQNGQLQVLSQGGMSFFRDNQIAMYFSVCILILFSKAFSVIMVNNIAKSATAALRLSIARKINLMRIDHVESIGFPRLLNILIEDVNNVTNAAVAIPMVLVSSVTILGMLAYLASLNVKIFLIVVFAIIFGVFLFRLPVSMASGLYARARALRDLIQEGIRGLVLGAYELKLNRAKSAAYIKDELEVPQQESVRLQKLGDAVLHLAGTSSDLLSFFIIGFFVFVLPRFLSFEVSDSYGVVMAMLYLAGPVGNIMGMMQQLQIGRIAINRIHGLDQYAPEGLTDTDSTPLPDWTEYRVEQVCYQYSGHNGSQDNGFALAPVSLTFGRGQINFIVGGNGSGKSTLSKLLSLHYSPASGSVFFDQEKVHPGNMVAARAKIGVIFSNYFLFGKLYCADPEVDSGRVNHYLNILGLQGKTEFIDGRFTTTRLSDGQRRRLALLVALLEDKDIYIFDEWAADQDPEFKRVFYQEILPDMKRNNKLVIVITHDDRYFACADRVIFMEDGKMIGQQSGKGEGSEPNPDAAAHSFFPPGVLNPPAPGLPT